MSASLALVAVMAVLYAVGFFMMLERSMTRVLLGFLLVGNATNLLILIVSGRAGAAPFFGQEGEVADPLPQAFILTSIVITFGVSAFLMALIYRSWRLANVDIVADDTEDIEVGRRTVSVTTERDVLGEDTEFGTRATAAVRDAVDLEELERREDQESVTEQLRLQELHDAMKDAQQEDATHGSEKHGEEHSGEHSEEEPNS